MNELLNQPITNTVKWIVNGLLILLGTAGVGVFGTNVAGYISSMISTFFTSLNTHSQNVDDVRWIRDTCIKAGRKCSTDLFAVDESAVPHLKALRDMFYGSDSLCGGTSCKDTLVDFWNSIHLTTFVTAIALVIFTIFCIPYIRYILSINNGVLPQHKRHLEITEE